MPRMSDLKNKGAPTPPEVIQTDPNATNIPIDMDFGATIVDASLGNKIVNLYALSTYIVGAQLTIQKSDSTSNTVTIVPYGTETIGGLTSLVLSAVGDSYTIQSTGTTWIVIAHNTNTTASLPPPFPSVVGQANKHLVVNSAGDAVTFKDSEIPSLTGQANKHLVVNSAATAVTFKDSEIPSLTNQADKMLVVNSTSDALTFISKLSLLTNTPKVITDDYFAQPGDLLLVDTRSKVINIYLPESPVLGDDVFCIDAGASWGTNNIRINGNGNLILGGTEDLVGDVSVRSFCVVFYDANDVGWTLKYF